VAVGTLAAGVAHEINNPLTILRGNVDCLRNMLSEQLACNDNYIKFFDAQERAIKRIVTIVNGLRTFARPDTDYVEPVNLNEIITDTLALLRPLIKESAVNISLQLDKDEATWVLGNIGKLQSVLTNLLINARDALRGGKNNFEIQVKTTAGDDDVILVVSDNGCGIDVEIISRIFDPFFTTKDTKDADSGTGLGLSICKNIVESFGGSIQVESVVGAGSSFTVKLT
jgi:signal transduction histidine kinase